MVTPKKAIEDIPAPGEQELLERMRRISDPEIRSYAAFIYLMGSRVSEAMGGYKKERTGSYEYTHPRTLKVTQQPVYKYSRDQLAYNGIKTWQIEIENNWLNIKNVPTLKRKDSKHFYRDAYVNLNGKNEQAFANMVMEYVNTRPRDAIVWSIRSGGRGHKGSFDRRKVWKTIKDATGIPPHKLRGMRATKDATVYGLDALDLKKKFNWGSSDMAFHYANKSPRDIKQKMERNIQ